MTLFSNAACSRIRERIRLFFGGAPRRRQAAALPWRLTEGRIELLLVTSRGTGRWVLPKGWPKEGETLCEAAAREAAEEAGISGTVAQDEIGRYHYGKRLSSGAVSPCEVLVFPLHVKELAACWPEMNERRRRWFAPREAARLVAEPDLAELIRGFAADPGSFAA